jgi:hypothetical protein
MGRRCPAGRSSSPPPSLFRNGRRDKINATANPKGTTATATVITEATPAEIPRLYKLQMRRVFIARKISSNSSRFAGWTSSEDPQTQMNWLSSKTIKAVAPQLERKKTQSGEKPGTSTGRLTADQNLKVPVLLGAAAKQHSLFTTCLDLATIATFRRLLSQATMQLCLDGLSLWISTSDNLTPTGWLDASESMRIGCIRVGLNFEVSRMFILRDDIPKKNVVRASNTNWSRDLYSSSLR